MKPIIATKFEKFINKQIEIELIGNIDMKFNVYINNILYNDTTDNIILINNNNPIRILIDETTIKKIDETNNSLTIYYINSERILIETKE